MRYWDASALMPLLLPEATTERMTARMSEDAAVVTWWTTPVECVSAIARLERDAFIDVLGATVALNRLRRMMQSWNEVPPTPLVREQTTRLLRLHPIRAGDALQLAAAIVASDFQPSTLELVTLDSRLATAAEREGFTVLAAS